MFLWGLGDHFIVFGHGRICELKNNLTTNFVLHLLILFSLSVIERAYVVGYWLLHVGYSGVLGFLCKLVRFWLFNKLSPATVKSDFNWSWSVNFRTFRLFRDGVLGFWGFGVLVCSFIGFRFPSGLACLDLSGRKNKWKSVWGENFKINA